MSIIPATGLPRLSERNHIRFRHSPVLSCLPHPISNPVSSAFTDTLGLDLQSGRQYGVRERGAVGPASPSGHYVEAPAAALSPALARREFPKSHPRVAAMLISPILFMILNRPCSLHCAPARSDGFQPCFRACETCSFRRRISCRRAGTRWRGRIGAVRSRP